jgi:GNAT superfamily N-acetyltransferase
MTGNGIVIRPAEPADFAAVADLLNSAYAGIGIDLGETAATIRERSKEALTSVLEIGGDIAGTLTIALAGSYYGRMARPGQMEVSRVAVAPRYQGNGLAMVMLESVAGACYDQGITAFVGASLDTMTAAHRVYESAGAVPTQIPGVKARTYSLQLTDEDATP